MSLIGDMFSGGENCGKAPTHQEEIQKLKLTEKMLQEKADLIEKRVEQERFIAKKNTTKDKRVALSALKRKKKYEKQLQGIRSTLSTLRSQRDALENASTNMDILELMGDSAKALKHAQKNMNVDQIHDTMDEIAEQQELANEISDAIANPVGFGHDVDDADLLKELEALEQKHLTEQPLEAQGQEHLTEQPLEAQGPDVLSSDPVSQPKKGQKAKATVGPCDHEMVKISM